MSLGPRSSAALSCSVDLKSYYDAYVALSTGQSEVRMRSADHREIEFARGDINAVLRMYIMLYEQCGAESGLPDLSGVTGTSLIRRGGPATIGC